MVRLREIDIKLVDELDVDNTTTGMREKRDIVTLTAPSAKHRKYASRLVQIFKAAQLEVQSVITSRVTKEQLEDARKKLEEEKKDGENIKDEDEKLQPEEIMNIVESSGDIDGLFDAFRDLITSENGCGKIGGQDITCALFDELSYEDMQYMCGRYISDFLLQSQRAKKSGRK